MSAAEPSVSLPYNGAMLRWARDWRGRTVEEAAARVHVTPDRIRAWEAGGDDVPTVRQARDLAEFYGRAFLEFFYDEKPEIHRSKLIPDFRLHRDAADPHQNREILEIQHWAEAQRLNALELYEDMGEAPPQFPLDLSANLDSDVETVAIKARAAIGFTIEAQRRLKAVQARQIPQILREKMEDVGVLVLRENALSAYGVSGLCIVQFPLPIIAYSTEAPGRQAFTLMHEFAHIVLRESAISGPEKARGGTGHDRRVERWCDKFASAFLIPETALADLRIKPAKPAPSIPDEALAELANSFRVSAHAMLIRLVNLGYVDADYYWGVKAPLFRAQEAAIKKGGRSKYWAERIVNKLGGMYTGLVLEAWRTQRIPFHQAADYMGLKNPAHLNLIKQEFGGA
jgi:Zn-dependent peptidase ImmA (M78 family)/transcriptional regulator with XRE-family HTH domain